MEYEHNVFCGCIISWVLLNSILACPTASVGKGTKAQRKAKQAASLPPSITPQWSSQLNNSTSIPSDPLLASHSNETLLLNSSVSTKLPPLTVPTPRQLPSSPPSNPVTQQSNTELAPAPGQKTSLGPHHVALNGVEDGPALVDLSLFSPSGTLPSSSPHGGEHIALP